jgi:hypothetical protein
MAEMDSRDSPVRATLNHNVVATLPHDIADSNEIAVSHSTNAVRRDSSRNSSSVEPEPIDSQALIEPAMPAPRPRPPAVPLRPLSLEGPAIAEKSPAARPYSLIDTPSIPEKSPAARPFSLADTPPSIPEQSPTAFITGSDTPHATTLELPNESSDPEITPSKIKKIPGIFQNQSGHNAMAAMAAAINGRGMLSKPMQTHSPMTSNEDLSSEKTSDLVTLTPPIQNSPLSNQNGEVIAIHALY